MTSPAQYQMLFLAASSPLFTYSPFLTERTSNDGSWIIPSATNSSTQDPLLAATLASVQSGLIGADVQTGGSSSNASAVSLNGVSGKSFMHDGHDESGNLPLYVEISHDHYPVLFLVKRLYRSTNFSANRPQPRDATFWLRDADRSRPIDQ
jgi:hypothetical protein